MVEKIKNFILSHEPFRPIHMGPWLRIVYFKKNLKKAGRPGAILDAGCGRGFYSFYLAGVFPDAAIAGYDIKRQKEWEKNSNSRLIFKEKDLNLLDEQDSYDLIISIDSLEHIPGNRRIMEKFYKALKDGGHLYLAIPCEDNERYIFPKGWFKKFDEWAEEEHTGEQYDLPRLEEILESIGFKVGYSRYTFTFFGHLAWEIETLLHGSGAGRKINVLAMPLLKILAFFDVIFPIGKGNDLIIARK